MKKEMEFTPWQERLKAELQTWHFSGLALWIKDEKPFFGYSSCKTIGAQKCYVLVRPGTAISDMAFLMTGKLI